MQYVSTRGKSLQRSFEDILLDGMAPDGGLYLPDSWPAVDIKWLARLSGLSYVALATQLLSFFCGRDFPQADLSRIVETAYGPHESRFDHSAICPLRQLGPNVWLMELFHGPTLSFKDVAMQLLGPLFDYVLEKRGSRVTVLAATSGDTGSAAIYGCEGRDNIDIFILHPHGKTSEVQRRQMTSVKAPNVHNLAVKGNFDDCQALVKTLFAKEDFRTEMNLTAVNSINWARIMAQMVYYFAAALSLGGPARPVSFVVPTGNFGNVFSAYAARQLGLPIERLIIANNPNDALAQFFSTGSMTPGKVSASYSPSMDIQVPSNFERYLFELLGRDSTRLRQIMGDVSQKRGFSLNAELIARARADFSAHKASDEETLQMISLCYETTGIIIDPHTAVGLHAAQQGHSDPETPLVALACAHPSKFPETVEKALGFRPPVPEKLASVLQTAERYDVIDNDAGILQTYMKKVRRR